MSQLIASRLTRLLPAMALPVAALWAMFGITALSPGWQLLLIKALPITCRLCLNRDFQFQIENIRKDSAAAQHKR